MRILNIDGTSLEVSAICLGNGFMKNKSEEDRLALLDAYTNMGGNMVDSALIYGYREETGTSASEAQLGRWMKSRGNRNRLVVTTKGAHPYPIGDPRMRLSREDIRADLEKSLKTLGTDFIDLYWLHRDDPERDVAEILSTMNELVREGRIRFFGCSNWAPSRIEEAAAYAFREGIRGFSANQLSWSVARSIPAKLAINKLCTMDGEGWRYHRRTGLAVFAYSSQARGLFARLETGSWETIPESYAQYDLSENRPRIDILLSLAKKKGITPSQAAIAWLMAQPFTVIPIVGCGSQAHLEEAMKAADMALVREEMEEIGLW